MARTTKFLLEQIERAKRLAAGMSSSAERERFEKIAADYQKEMTTPLPRPAISSLAPQPRPLPLRL
jgi:hypothetical protein